MPYICAFYCAQLACALASAKPIVTLAYWEAVHLAVRESKALPDIENFLPTVKEEWLKTCSRLLLPNEKRNVLFKGLSFVHFCAKQYFTYLPLIAAAGNVNRVCRQIAKLRYAAGQRREQQKRLTFQVANRACILQRGPSPLEI
jgi:hypothetical protein